MADAIEAYHRRVPTRRVNEVIAAAQAAQPAPHGGRILYATQGATDPPTFTLFANKALPAPYLRYLERRLREAFDLGRHADQAAGAPALELMSDAVGLASVSLSGRRRPLAGTRK